MTQLGLVLLGLPAGAFLWGFLVYPAVMWAMARLYRLELPHLDPEEWPEITISIPVYNEERAIGDTLENLLALDYPTDRRHLLVISDASSDRTDEIVRGFAERGVRLVRLAERGGKTAAENAAGPHLRGSIVVNTDATIRILPGALKPLIRVFQDPRIGLASGRDVSVGELSEEGNQGESGYVGYEMWIRSLETRAGSIVGASGCFYAIRRELFDFLFPSALSRDFASALITAEHGFRAVSVDAAVCLVPRTRSLRSEYRRKVRTMTRGLETLWYKRRVFAANGPLFGFALLSHKLIRWLVFLFAPLGLIGLVLLTPHFGWASWALVAVGVGLAFGSTAFLYPPGRRVPQPLAALGFLLAAYVAGLVAWTKALRGELNPVWEPTRRG